MTNKHTCHAVQMSSSMVCHRCQQMWDVNDPSPPECDMAALAYQDELVTFNEAEAAYLEHHLPPWAERRIKPTDDEPYPLRAQLPTKDGRRTGNAVISAIIDSDRFEVTTDMGNVIMLNRAELEEGFHAPEYVVSEEGMKDRPSTTDELVRLREMVKYSAIVIQDYERMGSELESIKQQALAQQAQEPVTHAVDHDVLHDSAWIAGAKFGWNCGVTGDNQQFNDAINARIKQRVAAKCNTPQPKPSAAIDEVEISRMTERGAKAWAGVDAQALREGGQPAPKTVKCRTCNDHGLIGGHMQDGSGYAEPCPDCNAPQAPIDMVLHCPSCGLQHIDEAERDLRDDFAVATGLANLSPYYTPWNNPPHRSHLCHGCGHIWRPADVPTNGVKAVLTKGKADSPLVCTTEALRPQAVPMTEEQMLTCLAAATHEVPARIPPGWKKVMRAVEAHHGITAQGEGATHQPTKEQP